MTSWTTISFSRKNNALVIRLRIVRPRFDSLQGKGNFSLLHRVQTDSGSHPASYPMDTGGYFLEVKQPGREAHRWHPSSAEVKNPCSYTSTPPYIFMAWYLVKHRATLLLYLCREIGGLGVRFRWARV
jgi:hypothetical protein